MARKFEYLVLLVWGSEWVASNGAFGKVALVEIPRGSGYNPGFALEGYDCGPVLNTLGKQGWELTGVVSHNTDASLSHVDFVFKRELE